MQSPKRVSSSSSSSMQAELQALQAELASVSAARDKLQDQLESIAAARGQTMFSSAYLLSERVKALESELQQLRGELAAARGERDSLREDIIQLRGAKRLSDMGWRDERLRSQDLARQLAAAAAEQQEEHAFDASLLQGRLARLEGGLAEVRAQATLEQQQRAQLEQQLEEAWQQRARAEAQLAQTTNGSGSGSAGQQPQQTEEAEALSAANVALQAELSATKVELAAVRSQAAAAQQAAQRLQAEHDKAIREAHEELVAMRKQASKVNKELGEKSARLSDMETLVEQTSAALLVSQSAVMQLQHDKTSGMELVRQEAAQTIQDLEARVKQMEVQLAGQDAGLAQAARDKLELMEELAAAEASVDGLQAHANELKIRLAHATEEKVAALLQLARVTGLEEHDGSSSSSPRTSRGLSPIPAPLASSPGRGSSSSPLPRLQRLPSALWHKLVEGQAAVRLQLQHLGLQGSHHEELCTSHHHQQQQEETWMNGEQQQQKEIQEQGQQVSAAELLQRLQLAAQLVAEFKAALASSASSSRPEPEAAEATAMSPTSRQLHGHAGHSRAAAAGQPRMQQLHEELQQRWKRMGMAEDGSRRPALLRTVSEAGANTASSSSSSSSSSNGRSGTHAPPGANSSSSGGSCKPLERSISHPPAAGSSSSSGGRGISAGMASSSPADVSTAPGATGAAAAAAVGAPEMVLPPVLTHSIAAGGSSSAVQAQALAAGSTPAENSGQGGARETRAAAAAACVAAVPALACLASSSSSSHSRAEALECPATLGKHTAALLPLAAGSDGPGSHSSASPTLGCSSPACRSSSREGAVASMLGKGKASHTSSPGLPLDGEGCVKAAVQQQKEQEASGSSSSSSRTKETSQHVEWTPGGGGKSAAAGAAVVGEAAGRLEACRGSLPSATAAGEGNHQQAGSCGSLATVASPPGFAAGAAGCTQTAPCKPPSQQPLRRQQQGQRQRPDPCAVLEAVKVMEETLAALQGALGGPMQL